MSIGKRIISTILIAAVVVQISCVSNISTVNAKNKLNDRKDGEINKWESVVDSVYQSSIPKKETDYINGQETVTTVIPVQTPTVKEVSEETSDIIVSEADFKSIDIKRVGEKKRILVKYKNSGNMQKLSKSDKGNSKFSRLKKKKSIETKQIEIYEIDDSNYFDDVVNELKKDSLVEYVQEDYRLDIFEYPEDSRFLEQWALENIGQAIEGIKGVSGVDVNALAAWDKTKGSSEVVIGILDTGIDIYSEELRDAIYVNVNEIPGNGIDDDNNGYVDDVKGWDFANDDNTVYDSAAQDKHGTQIAGIIAAQHNLKGICGISPNVKIIPLKFISDGYGYTSDVIEAIEYCEKMNINIVNCSWGSTKENPALQQAMVNSNVLFITAAGNYGGDSSKYPVFPANYELPNIISVAAIDNNGEIAAFSNYGKNVHIAAPGVNILSVLPGNNYGMVSGTSMAAPFVTGIAALIKSYNKDISIMDIKDRIVNNVVSSEKLTGKVFSGGRVDAYAALENKGPVQESQKPEIQVTPKVTVKPGAEPTPCIENNNANKDISKEIKIDGSLESKGNKLLKPIMLDDNNYSNMAKNVTSSVYEIGLDTIRDDINPQSFSLLSYTFEVEKNNTSSTAMPIDIGTVYGTFDADDSNDWFVVYLQGNTEYTIKLKGIADGNDYDLRVYDNELSQVGGSYSAGNFDESITINTKNSSTYYLNVSRFSFSEEVDNSYQLLIYPNSSHPDEYEANDSINTAKSIITDKDIYGTINTNSDEDWYVVNVEKAGRLTVSLLDIPFNCDYELSVYSEESTYIGGSYRTGNDNEKMTITVDTPSTYYIRIYSYKGCEPDNNYTLRASVSSPDAYEENDTMSDAKNIQVGSSVLATIDNPDDTDWYKFFVKDSMDYSIELKNIPSERDYDLYLFNEAYCIAGSCFEDNTDELLNVKLTEGTYYIKVVSSSRSFSQTDSYAISVKNGNDIIISMPFAKVDSGSIIEVPVMIENIPKEGITCFNFAISYDKNILSYVGNSQGSMEYIKSDDLVIQEAEDGIRILYLDNSLRNPIRSSGVLVNLKFEANNNVAEGTTTIGYNDNWAFASFADNKFGIHSQVKFKAGNLSFGEFMTYSAEYNNLIMDQPIMITTYSEERVVGDINGDGAFNSIDCAMLRAILLGYKIELPEDYEWAADVDDSGTVNSLDFAYMRSNLLGKVKFFPKERPTEPSNLKVTSKTASAITLSWDESTGLADIAYYEIYRDSVLCGESTTNSFQDSGLIINSNYIYEIIAVDIKGRKSIESNSIEVFFEGVTDVEAPSAPGNFMVNWYTGVAVSLTWDAPEDATAVEGYEVYSGNTLLTFVKDTSVIYTGLTCNTSYTLTVKAVDVLGNRSADSNEVVFTTGSDDYGNSHTNAVYLKLGEENKISGVLESKTDEDCFLIKPPVNGVYRIKIINETTDREIIGYLYNGFWGHSFSTVEPISGNFYYIKEVLFSDNTYKLSVKYTRKILKDDGYSPKYNKYTILVEQVPPDWTADEISSNATEIEIDTEISGKIRFGLLDSISKSDYYKFKIPEDGYYIFEYSEGILNQICDSDNEFPSCKKEYTEEKLKKYYFEKGDYYVRIYTTNESIYDYTFKVYKAKPDFRISSISPSVVLQSDTVELKAVVVNRGHEYIDGKNTFRVGFLIDDVNIVYSDYCTQVIGEGKQIVLSAKADASLFNKLGNHTVRAFIEKGTDFEEIDENNNTLVTKIFTDDYPDKKEESRKISVNKNIEGSIGFEEDYDWLTFTPEIEGYYRIVASCDEKVSNEIEVCLGNQDDDSLLLLGYLSAEKNSISILRNFEKNKTYYIRLNGSIGNYKLSVDYAKPNLDITQVSPEIVFAGEKTTFSVAVKNIGDIYLEANSFRVGIKLDDNEDIIWSDYNSKYLSVNSTISLNVEGCFYTVGEHTITVVIDYNNDLFNDNGFKGVSKNIYVDYLDLKLKVSSITPTIIGLDNPVQFTVSVTNNGDKSLKLGKPLKVILKDKNDNILAYGESSSFTRGSSNLILLDKGGIDGKGSVIFDKAGLAEVVAYVESCEEDSSYQTEIRVIKDTDLEILDITYSPESIGLNEQVTFKVNIINKSSMNLNANIFRVGLKIDDSEDIIWSSYNSSISANGTAIFSVRGLINTTGEHTVTAFIEYNGNIFGEKETIEFTKTIFIKHPDLQVTNISPKYVLIGESTQFTVDVINNESVLHTGQLLKVVLKDKDENILAYGEVDSFIDKGKSISVLLDKGGIDGKGSVIFDKAGLAEVVAYVESCEEDSSYQTEIRVIKDTDLEILDITYSPESIGLNEQVTFKVNIINKSSMNLNANIFRVGLKLDDSEDIIWSSYNSSISANGTAIFSVRGLINTTGELTITAFIDYNSNITKEKETVGFTKTIFIRHPDIQVTNISPKYVLIGESTQFTVDVINNESVLHTGQLLKVVLKDKDENILAYGEVDSFIDKGKSISVLLDKGGADGNGNVVFNELGIAEISAYIDTENVIEESNEENNSYQTEINVIKKPDLKVLDITYSPVEIKEGEKVVFKAKVKNCSDGMVIPSNLKVNFKIDTDTVISSATYNKEIYSNEILEFTAETTWTALLGEHNITAIVDEENLVIESNDLNNSYTEKIIVGKKPDLIVTDISYSPEVPKTADEIVFRATIKNIGEGSSPAGRTHRVGFKVDNSETLFWSDHFSWSIEPGESITVDVSWGKNGSKWLAVEGEHIITAEVNDTRLIEETEYANNIYSESISIAGLSMLNLYDDYDNDGIDNATEIELGTNLMSSDTDGDGISDGEELRLLSNPLLPDSDGDGILDGNELKLGMNLLVADENTIVSRTCSTPDENVIVTAYGDLNINAKPFKVIVNDTFLNSLEGIIGSPVDISLGNYEIESASITFKYSLDQLNGLDENKLKIYWVDTENGKLVPVESQEIDTVSKSVTCEVNHFSTYIMGVDLETDLTNVDIVFAVDRSGSMDSNDPYFFRLNAINRFVSDMDVLKFRVGIVEYADSAQTKHIISDNKTSLQSVLKSIYDYGGTNFGAGLNRSQELFQNSGNRNKVIVLLSDGGNNEGYSNNSVIDLSKSIYSKGVNIYTISLGQSADIKLMESISEAGGGRNFYIDSAAQIEPVYQQIMSMIGIGRGYSDSYGSYYPGCVIMYDLSAVQQLVKVEDVQSRLSDGWTFYPKTGNEARITVNECDYSEITWTLTNAKFKILNIVNCKTEESVQSTIIYEDGDYTSKSLNSDTLYRGELLQLSQVLDFEYAYTKTNIEDGSPIKSAKYYLELLGYKNLKNSNGVFSEEKDDKFYAAINDFIKVFNLEKDYEDSGKNEEVLYNWLKIAANNLRIYTEIRLSKDKKTLVNEYGQQLYTDFVSEFYEFGISPEVVDNLLICVAPSRLLLNGEIIKKYILMTRENLINTRKMGRPSVKLILPSTLSIYNEVDGITIKAEGENCAYIYAYVNGKNVAVQSGNSFSYKFTPKSEGLYEIYVEGRNAADYKGNIARSSKVSVMVRFSVASIIRYYPLNFNGNDRVYLGNNNEVKPKSEITISMWVKPSSIQAANATIISCEGVKSGYAIKQDGNNTNKYIFSYWNESGKEFKTESVALQPDCWQHIAVQKTIGGLDSYLWFYVNGERLGMGSQYGDIGYDSKSELYLGTYANSPGSRNFKGSLDDVAIWNRALSIEEIKEVINNGAETNTDGLIKIIKNSSVSQSTEVKNCKLDFDGSYKVNLGPVNKILSGKEMTIAMWVRPLSHKTSYANILSCEGNQIGYSIEQNGNASDYYVFKYWNGKAWKRTDSIRLNTGSWQHIAVSISEDEEIKFILNGGEDINYSYGSVLWDNTNLYLGTDASSPGSENFKGSIHQLGIWNRELTLEEIKNVMENGPESKLYGLQQVCKSSTSNFIKNEVEILEYIINDLSFEHLSDITIVGGNTIEIKGGYLKKSDGSDYRYTISLPINARLIDGLYYAADEEITDIIFKYMIEKSSRGIYFDEYELGGGEYIYSTACNPLYTNMVLDRGDIISKKDFINMMGPQWEFKFAGSTVNLELIDVVHRFLDLGGMIPVFGPAFDGVNAIIYFAEGDMVNMCLSMLGTIEVIGLGYAGLKVATKAIKKADLMMLGKNSLKVATDSIGLIKVGKTNMLDDIASITRIQNGYEFVTESGIIFKMLDDDIPSAAKSVVKAMSDSTDDLMTCLKTEPEALFELVEETKDLDNTILYRLRDDTEIHLFKSDLTPEQIICSTIGCFTGDTLVTTKEGLKRIDEVKTGDYVLSKDVKSGESAYKKVNYVYIKNTSKLVKLIVGNEEINTTSSHLFFTDSGWWKSAKNITVGDRILTSDGELKEVTAIRVVELEEAVRIYNLNVDEFHTYYVGRQGLLVHNDCTLDMMAAGREAIEAARLRGITDPKILSEIGEAAAAEATTIMKMLYEADAFAEQGLKLSGDALNNWKDNIWNMEDSKMRGMIIESFLSKTDYSTWGFMGRESGGYWKGFDFADDYSGTIASLKTLDPRLSSYAADGGYSAIKGYIDELYDLGEVTMADGQVVAKKILDVRVPAGTIGNVARDRLMNYINNTYNGTIGLVIKEF